VASSDAGPDEHPAKAISKHETNATTRIMPGHPGPRT
jgi:hypothetical protein